ncbi:hypothetical protein G6F68_016039 [Rhizopus microsporus]|nr:hypothetical protein G6F68_016039 [Rhizopus microsporus]
MVRQQLQAFFQQQEGQRAHDGAEQRADAAQHHHHDQFSRRGPGQVRRRHIHRQVSQQHAGHAADHCGNHIRSQAVAQGRKAQCAHAPFIGLAAAQGHAEGRVDHAVHQPQHGQQHAEGRVVQGQRRIQPERAEVAACEQRHAIVAAKAAMPEVSITT